MDGATIPFPEIVLVIAFAAAIVVACVLRCRGRRRIGRRLQALTLISLLGLIAITPGFDPPAIGSADRLTVVLLDLSRSMSIDPLPLLATDRIMNGGEERVVVIGFAAEAVTLFDGPATNLPPGLEPFPRLVSRAFRGSSRLDRALRLAREVPRPGEQVRLVIVSDGGFDLASARASMSGELAFTLAGIEVLPGPDSSDENASIRFVTEPLSVLDDASFTVELEVNGRVLRPRELTVEIGGQAVGNVTLTPRISSVRLRVASRAFDQTRPSLDARIRPAAGWDRDPLDDHARLFLHHRRELPRTLVLSDDPNRSADRLGWLKPHLGDVEFADASAGVAMGLDSTDLVIVDELAADGSPAANRLFERLEGFVGRGGGLFLTGVERSFGAGGWERTRIDALSPLRSRPDDAPRQVTVCLDRSGSMEQGGRFEAAARATLSLHEGLDAADRLELLLFGDRLEPVREWRGGENRRELEAFLAAIRPSGGTRLAPAIDAAVGSRAPDGVQSIVLLLSDAEDPESLAPESVRRWNRLCREGRHALHVLWFDRDESRRSELSRLVDGTGGGLHEVDDFSELLSPFLAATRRGLRVSPARLKKRDEPDVVVPALLRTKRDPSASVLIAHDDRSAALAVVARGSGRVAAAPLALDRGGVEALFGGGSGLASFLAELVAGDPRAPARIALETSGGGWRYRIHDGPNRSDDLELRCDDLGLPLRRLGPSTWVSSTFWSPPVAGMAVIHDSEGVALMRRPVRGADLSDGLPAASMSRVRRLVEGLAPDASRGWGSRSAGLLLLAFLGIVAESVLRSLGR